VTACGAAPSEPATEGDPGVAISGGPASRAGRPARERRRPGRFALGDDAFTVVALPDTQFYTESFPEIFDAQARWIAANRDVERIALVLHEGDIVNADDHVQWSRAAAAMHVLDGVVPYALARGNHDLARGLSRLGGLMDSYFPSSGFLKYPWFRETFEVGRMDNSFLMVEAAGQAFVVLALEYGARDAVLAWADDILTRHAAVPALVVTHAYLYSDNTRYDYLRAPQQLYNPHEMTLEGGVNDGEEMWQKLISRHPNVLVVVSGHVTEGGVGRLTSTRADGTRCHQILADYQSYERGGDGFLRLLRFEPSARRLVVRTYSPTRNLFKTDPDNDFVLELD
jgi:hypothetical protein